jgi:hypothetical protein
MCFPRDAISMRAIGTISFVYYMVTVFLSITLWMKEYFI